MKAFLRDGNWLGKAPMGYQHEGPRTTDHNRYNRIQRITVNETGIKLKQAWQWILEGVQDYIILQRLNELGVNIRLQKPGAMWRNPFYCGLITNRLIDGELFEGNHEQLISREVFLKINQINTKRPHGYNIEKLCDYRPLIGYILCYRCGRKLSGYLVKSKRLHSYKCQKCKGMNLNAITSNEKRTGAHELFVTMLSSYKVESGYIEMIKDQITKDGKTNGQLI